MRTRRLLRTPRAAVGRGDLLFRAALPVPARDLLVAGFGLVIDGASARARVIEFILANVPLQEDQGRRELEDVLTSVTEGGGEFGLAGALGLVVTASGVMGAIRQALNRAWNVQDARPLVQGKLVDVLLVCGSGS